MSFTKKLIPSNDYNEVPQDVNITEGYERFDESFNAFIDRGHFPEQETPAPEDKLLMINKQSNKLEEVKLSSLAKQTRESIINVTGASILDLGIIGESLAAAAENTTRFNQNRGARLIIPDGYYFVDEDVDLGGSFGSGVIINIKSGRRLPYNSTQEKNKLQPIFGSNFSTGDPSQGGYGADQLKAIIDRLNRIPHRPFAMVFHLNIDVATNTVGIYQLDGVNGNTEAQVDFGIDQMTSRGMFLKMIKVHPTSSSTSSQLNNITNVSAFWAAYRYAIDRLLTKFQGKCEYFSICNEEPRLTANPVHDAGIRDVIQLVKNRGFKVGMTNTRLEVEENRHLHLLDFIGVNQYPYVSNNSLRTTKQDAINAWVTTLEQFRALKARYPNTEIFLTETACQDRDESLAFPGQWSYPPGTPNNGGKIMSIFWEGALNALKDNTDIKYVFGWDFESNFSPWVFDSSTNTIKTYIL